MLHTEIREYTAKNEYIEITHASGDTLRISLNKSLNYSAVISIDAKKEDFKIVRKEVIKPILS